MNTTRSITTNAFNIERGNYYPFGMEQPGRIDPGDNTYRYGFNGKEKDDEIDGVSGSKLDFGARIYDSRLGRWLALDPLQQKYPNLSPYNFVANSPIFFIDPDGKKILIHGTKAEKTKIINALAVIASTEKGGAMLAELSKSKRIFNIYNVIGEISNYSETGGFENEGNLKVDIGENIFYTNDPKDGAQGGIFDLTHEIKHMYDDLVNRNYTREYWEKDAMRFANRIRSVLGYKDFRTIYDNNDFFAFFDLEDNDYELRNYKTGDWENESDWNPFGESLSNFKFNEVNVGSDDFSRAVAFYTYSLKPGTEENQPNTIYYDYTTESGETERRMTEIVKE